VCRLLVRTRDSGFNVQRPGARACLELTLQLQPRRGTLLHRCLHQCAPNGQEDRYRAVVFVGATQVDAGRMHTDLPGALIPGTVSLGVFVLRLHWAEYRDEGEEDIDEGNQ
jgi:hypothetical protein